MAKRKSLYHLHNIGTQINYFLISILYARLGQHNTFEIVGVMGGPNTYQ